MIHSAKVASTLSAMTAISAACTVPASLEMAEVRARKRRMVEGLVSMQAWTNTRESGAELVFGEVAASSDRTPFRFDRSSGNGVRTLRGDLACSSIWALTRLSPGHPQASRREAAHARRGARALTAFLSHLTPVLSAAAMLAWNSRRHSPVFGSRVTVLERGPQLLPREDKDVADSLIEFLHLDGASMFV